MEPVKRPAPRAAVILAQTGVVLLVEVHVQRALREHNVAVGNGVK